MALLGARPGTRAQLRRRAHYRAQRLAAAGVACPRLLDEALRFLETPGACWRAARERLDQRRAEARGRIRNGDLRDPQKLLALAPELEHVLDARLLRRWALDRADPG